MNTVYIFSNVKCKIKLQNITQNDILVFLNDAVQYNKYKDVNCKKFLVRRWMVSLNKYAGHIIDEIEILYLFGQKNFISKEQTDYINKLYDFNFKTPWKQKQPTTGWICYNIFKKRYADYNVKLINFFPSTDFSTSHCQCHNWKFQDQFYKKNNVEIIDLRQKQLVYCCDKNYIDILNLSAQSVQKYNKNFNINVVSTNKIDTKYNNFIYNIDGFNFKQRINDRITRTAYLKLFLQLLPYDKILFIDCDIFCKGNLNDLYNEKVDYIKLCHSHDYGIKQANDFHHDIYYNTGVMLMNLKKLRQINFLNMVIKYADNGKFPNTDWQHDQTIINDLLYDKLQLLDLKYNYCYNRPYNKYSDSKNVNVDNCVLLHFIGDQKNTMKQYFKNNFR